MGSSEKEVAAIIKFEPYVLGLFCLTLVLRSLHLPFSAQLFIISCSSLAMIYMFKASIKKENLDSTSQFLRKGLLYLVSVGLISLLFAVQKWPNSKGMMITFLTGIAVIAVISVIKNIQIKHLINMTEGMLILGLFLLITSSYFNLI